MDSHVICPHCIAIGIATAASGYAYFRGFVSVKADQIKHSLARPALKKQEEKKNEPSRKD
jgi:hypothetical protein